MNRMLALWLLLCFFTLVCSLILDPGDVDASFLACYDYIICGGVPCADPHSSQVLTDSSAGCGVSGLVLANRLTEDPNGTSPEFFLTKQWLTCQSHRPGARSWRRASPLAQITPPDANDSVAIITRTSLCTPSKTDMAWVQFMTGIFGPFLRHTLMAPYVRMIWVGVLVAAV